MSISLMKQWTYGGPYLLSTFKKTSSALCRKAPTTRVGSFPLGLSYGANTVNLTTGGTSSPLRLRPFNETLQPTKAPLASAGEARRVVWLHWPADQPLKAPLRGGLCG